MYDKQTNLHLVSKYNPQKEASRFVQQLSTDGIITTTSIIIILGPVSHYLYESLKAYQISDNNMVFCFYKKSHVQNFPSSNYWLFDGAIPLHIYLENSISMHDISKLSVIEWKPTVASYPEISRAIQKEITTFSRRIKSNIHTYGKFGLRWMKNFVKNISKTKKLYHDMKVKGNCLLAIPGPSLLYSIPLIKEHRENLFVTALSSALRPLSMHGIEPDCVIQTDGGYYASRLLDYCRNQNLLHVVSLTSTPISSDAAFLLRNGNPLDAILPQEIIESTLCIPDQGTVTSTALDFLINVIDGNIFVCGLDLEHPIDTLHTSEHLQDYLWDVSQDRLHPRYTNSIDSVLSSSTHLDRGYFIDSKLNQYRMHLADRYRQIEHIYRVLPTSIQIFKNHISLDEFDLKISAGIPPSFSIKSIDINLQMKNRFIENLKNLINDLYSLKGSRFYKELFLYLDTQQYLRGAWDTNQKVREKLMEISGLIRDTI